MKHRRKQVLINPKLQWKFILTFTCLASAAVMFEAIVVNRMLLRLTDTLPSGGDILLAELNGILMGGMSYTLLFLVPVAVGLGCLATFRVAGPLYGIRKYLERVAAGEETGECRIRKRDELHDLCAAVNAAVTTLRAERQQASEEGPEPTSDDAADHVTGEGEEGGEEPSPMRLVS